MGMTIANFEKNSDYATAGGVWQWSYGQILRLQGLDLPPAVEIHFSLQKTGADCKTRDGVTKDGVTDVQIPNSMLENDGAMQDYDVYAFVYLTDETSGQTIKYVRIPIYARSKPEAFEKPEDAELFRKAIAAVNESANRAETALAGAETARDEAQATADGIREEVQGMVDEANAAKNTAIEKANISTNNAEETEADRQETEQNAAVAKSYMEKSIEAGEKSEKALNDFLATLAAQPKRYYKLSVEEMNSIPNPNTDDLCYVVDLENSRTAIYFYDSADVDGDEVNPEWQFLGNAEFAQMDRTTLLKILDLATVAISGQYSDLLGIPNKYDSPLVLDGTSDAIAWDYSQGDTALVTLTADKALTISNSYNGARASLDVYGAKLALDDTTYLKSATYAYLEAIEGEHYHYEFQRIADKWQVGMMVVAGGAAE